MSVTHTVIAQHSHREHQTEQAYAPGHEHEKMQKYTCLMHPDVITDHPGNCPKCGMELVPLKQKIGHAMTRNSATRIFPFRRARSLCIRLELFHRCYSTPDHPVHFPSLN